MEMNKLMTMVGMRKGMLQWRTKQSNMSDLRRARMHPVFWLRSCVDVPLRIDACRKEFLENETRRPNRISFDLHFI